MTTTQTPGKKPVRPIRAPNAGNGGERVPPVNGQNNNKANQQPNVLSNNKSNLTKSALKFAFMPEIGRSLEGVKLAWHLLINLVAQIYVVVKLIPENHPCADFRNASEYKLKNIIKIAYNSLRWEKSQVPQIIIFFAVLLFLLFIALSLVTLVLSVGVNAAHAQTTSSTGNSANDILNSIFNLQGSGMIPTAFGAMLRAYSNIILVLAGIILLYLIMQYVVESARHGQPGGKSFNHAWAPVRMVFALGLLIPLSSGLNSGQYITLYLAKWGSDMASNVYKQFAVSLQSGQGITVSQVTVQPKKALENLFNLEACLAHYNVQNLGSMISSPNMQDDPAQPNGKILDFSGTTLGTATGCGKIHFYYNATATNPNEVLLTKQYTFFLDYLPKIQTLAQDFISHSDPQSTNYFQAIQTSTYSDQISSLATSYSQQINTAAQTAISDTNTQLGQEMQNSINSIGWVTAPTWLQRIANQNSAVADAQFSLPDVTNNSEDYAGQAMGKTSSPSTASTPEEIESWKSQTAAKAQDIGQNALTKIFSGTIPQVGPLLYKSLIMDASNPFCNLVAFGKTLFRAAEAAYAGWVSIVTALGLSATSIMGNQINVGPALIQSITPMVTAFIGMTFMTGMMLGFMLPLIPTIRFIFAVLGWIIMVFVAVMGMPLFALAHLKTGGEGWIGSLQVASAYNLLIGIIIRPTLIILGFVASLVVFNTVMKMAGTLLYMSATSDNAGYNGYMNTVDSLDYLAQIIKLFIFSTFVQAVANACFKLVDIVPSQAMTWMGTGPQSSAVEGGADEASNLAQNLGGQMSSAFHGRLQNRASNAMEDMRLLRGAQNKITPALTKQGPEADDKASGGIPSSGADAAKSGALGAGPAGSKSGAGEIPSSKNASQIPASKESADAIQITSGTLGSAMASSAGQAAGASTSGASAATASGGGASSSSSSGANEDSGSDDSSTADTSSSSTAAPSAAATGSNQAAQMPADTGKAADNNKSTPGFMDKVAAVAKNNNPFSADTIKGYSQNKNIAWGVGMGLAQSFIPGGRLLGLAVNHSLRKQTRNASADIFNKASEMDKANLSATGDVPAGKTAPQPEAQGDTTSSNMPPPVQPSRDDPNNYGIGKPYPESERPKWG